MHARINWHILEACIHNIGAPLQHVPAISALQENMLTDAEVLLVNLYIDDIKARSLSLQKIFNDARKR